jgi:hypothetical protein
VRILGVLERIVDQTSFVLIRSRISKQKKILLIEWRMLVNSFCFTICGSIAVDRDGEADDPPNSNPHNGQADNLNILDADFQLLINAPDPPSVHAQGSHSLADGMPAASSNGDQNPPNSSKNTSGSAQNYGEGPDPC